jgi:hypothetical protein
MYAMGGSHAFMYDMRGMNVRDGWGWMCALGGGCIRWVGWMDGCVRWDARVHASVAWDGCGAHAFLVCHRIACMNACARAFTNPHIHIYLGTCTAAGTCTGMCIMHAMMHHR